MFRPWTSKGHVLITALGFLALFIFGVPFLQMFGDASLWPILVDLASGILGLLALYFVVVPNLQLHSPGRLGAQMASGKREVQSAWMRP